MNLTDFLPQYRKYASANLKPRTITEYNRILATLILPKFGQTDLSKITTGQIERWHLKLRENTPVQANRALAVLSSVLQLAARWSHIPVNPARGIQIAKEAARERYLNPDEVKRLMAAIAELGSVQQAFLTTALYTGARPGELASAEWSFYKPGVLELPDTKTGKRTVYLPEQVETVLLALPRGQHSIIFPYVNPTLLWRKVRRKAKLEGLRLYDLRHTFASAALDGGASLEAISQLLGHRNPRTTRRYVHLMKQTGNETAALTAAAIGRMIGG